MKTITKTEKGKTFTFCSLSMRSVTDANIQVPSPASLAFARFLSDLSYSFLACWVYRDIELIREYAYKQ